MKRILSVAVIMLLTVLNISAQNNTKGYYGDVLIDGGIGLSSKWYIPATIYLDLTKHTLLSVKDDKDYSSLDTLYQNSVFIGNEYDENGYLLYPDGAPRFRVLYVNGGSSFSHGRSVGEEGRRNIMQFILNGGSYVGTCAGSALSSKGVIWDNGFRIQEQYFAIWPGVIRRSEASRIYTGMNIPKKSPLLRDCIKAWGIGGGICAFGEGMRRVFLSFGADPDADSTVLEMCLRAAVEWYAQAGVPAQTDGYLYEFWVANLAAWMYDNRGNSEANAQIPIYIISSVHQLRAKT